MREFAQGFSHLGMNGGEAGLLRLFKTVGCDAVVSDDQKFLDLVKVLEVPFTTSSGLLIYAWKTKEISREECLKLLGKLKSVISEEEYQLALFELKRGG